MRIVISWQTYAAGVDNGDEVAACWAGQTASLAVAVRSHGFVVLCQPASSLRLIWCCCSSTRSFESGFLQTKPHGQALAIR
jgi:hypothetical protein